MRYIRTFVHAYPYKLSSFYLNKFHLCKEQTKHSPLNWLQGWYGVVNQRAPIPQPPPPPPPRPHPLRTFTRLSQQVAIHTQIHRYEADLLGIHMMERLE